MSGSTRIVDTYYRLLLGDNTLTGEDTARQIIEATIKVASELESLEEDETARAQSSDWYEPGKPIRGWRKAVSAYENLLVGLLAASSIDDGPTAALRIFWGSTELPIATKAAANALGEPHRLPWLHQSRPAAAAPLNKRTTFIATFRQGNLPSWSNWKNRGL